MSDDGTRAVLERLMRIAEEKTGMTREQLLEAARHEGDRMPPRPSPVELGKMRGVPEIHWEALGAPKECEAIAAVRELVSSGQTFLVLLGGTRTMKSGSAAWAVGYANSGVFVSAREYLRLATSRADEERERVYYMQRSDLFVLDEMGTEYHADSGWARSELDGLFQYRYERKLKLIATANLMPDRFLERYGDRIVDRVRRAGRFVGTGERDLHGAWQPQ